MGECPDWYPLIRASKYLGVAPWELARQPAIWQHLALAAESAETEAQRIAQEREARKSKHGVHSR